MTPVFDRRLSFAYTIFRILNIDLTLALSFKERECL